MMRFLIIFSVILSLLQASSVDVKIKKTAANLNSIAQNQSVINKRMAQNAKEILGIKKEIDVQNSDLTRLSQELNLKEKSYGDNLSLLGTLEKQQSELKRKQDTLEQELVYTIAQSVSLSIVLQEKFSGSEASVMEYEVLQKMLKISKENIAKLNTQFYITSQDIQQVDRQAKTLKSAIGTIDTKKKELLDVQAKNKASLAQLQKKEKEYQKELTYIMDKQDELKRTLSKLNIIKIDEIRRAKEKEERRVAFSGKKTLTIKPSTSDSSQSSSDTSTASTKQQGSSYQMGRTKAYTGETTIAPLDSYSVAKKYGNYTDPVYGIKIFNESVTLRPSEAGAKVKTVFNGKVIYADKTAVLNYIVIVEHENGLHTIYANLSQISPDVQKGLKIKKGYTIGRVNDELVFEVTQQSYHIDPLTLIR